MEYFANTSHKPVWESNVWGSGCMPNGSVFYLYGLSLFPDADSSPESVMAIRDHSVISFQLAQSRVMSVPARVGMGDMPAVQTQGEEDLELVRAWDAREVIPENARLVRLRHDGPAARADVAGKPFELKPLQMFRFVLDIAHPVVAPPWVFFGPPYAPRGFWVRSDLCVARVECPMCGSKVWEPCTSLIGEVRGTYQGQTHWKRRKVDKESRGTAALTISVRCLGPGGPPSGGYTVAVELPPEMTMVPGEEREDG